MNPSPHLNEPISFQKKSDQQSDQKEVHAEPGTESSLNNLSPETEMPQSEDEVHYNELQRLRDENKLLKEKYTELYDIAPVGYITLSQDAEILELNHTAARLLGHERDNLINQNLYPFISPDTKSCFTLFLEKVFKDKHKHECDIIIKNKNASIYLFLNGKAGEDNNQCYITAVDVSERRLTEALRKSEEKFRLLTENAFDGIYLLINNTFEYVNQRFCELTGYSYQQLVTEKMHTTQLLAENSPDHFDGGWRSKPIDKHTKSIFEMGIKTRSGKMVDVEVSTTPVGIGNQTLILGIIRNISEKKQNEKLLLDVAVAKQAVRFKQKFLSNMSHELRTPLTGVLGMVELLSLSSLDRNQYDLVNTLKLSTENLIEVINQILDYSKIESGRVKLHRNIFPITNIFHNARRYFAAICQKDIHLEVTSDNNLPRIIQADEARLRQVITNLVSNAVKFTHSGKIILHAFIEKWIDEKTLSIGVSVSDTGVGIPESFISMIFHPFEQSEYSRKNIYFEGTGLGLPTCKELVELMGGSITASSVEGKGSTFTFTFIAERADNMEEAMDWDEVISSDTDRKVRILFAEDKVINQKVVTLLLESLGYEVVVAGNGEEALKKYRPGYFDLILMDIQMPVMDGVEATKKLKSLYMDLPPVIALTANASEGDREKYLSLGMDEYLAKPVKGEDLQLLVKRFISWYH